MCFENAHGRASTISVSVATSATYCVPFFP